MKLVSPAFTAGGSIPTQYTCDGEEALPTLILRDVPAEARSLAIIIDDPDAPVGTWTHWLAWNINTSTLEFSENKPLPEGSSEGITSAGTRGYHGPCPPSGIHRYFFKVYALDKILDIPGESRAEDLIMAMQNSIIDYAELIGLYKRQPK